MRLPLHVLNVVVLALVAAACASSSAITDPASAQTCEDLVELASERIRAVVTDLGTATLEQLEADNPEDPFASMTEPFVGFGERAATLGCLEAEIDQMTCDRLTGLEARGPVAEEFLAGYFESCG